jgi:CheY-like chemotaxis protein
MRMPVMNGWEFSRAYHATPAPHAPIIVVTAARDAADRASQIQAEGYLAKPFDLDDLLTLVGRFAAS